MRNTLNWFDIFVTQMPRAQAFYEQTLGIKLKNEAFGGEAHALFNDEGQTGALVKRESRKPSAEGTLVYLNCNGKLDAVLARVEKAGGKILMPKKDIGPPGFISVISDTEGNSVGLHSERD